eukprot:3621609-Pyramimonas_sp.AAC.1
MRTNRMVMCWLVGYQCLPALGFIDWLDYSPVEDHAKGLSFKIERPPVKMKFKLEPNGGWRTQ